MTFEKELKSLLNRYSKENESNTPDYILANYIIGCLAIFGVTVQQRETWYGRDARPSFTTHIDPSPETPAGGWKSSFPDDCDGGVSPETPAGGGK